MKSNLIQHAQELLTKSTGHSISLIDPQPLSDQNTVLRCQLDPVQPAPASHSVHPIATTVAWKSVAIGLDWG